MSNKIEHTCANRRILVTGGLGFVGYHLCHALLNTYPDCVLTVVDNLSSTVLDYQTLRSRAEIHICDLRDFSPRNPDYDDIYHLASPVGSLQILKRHGQIARDILELAHAANDIAAKCSAQLLYLSSSEVYGRDGEHSETADQVVPDRRGTRMEYALGKLTAEHVLLNLADSHTHNVRIVRPFNIIGEHQSEELGFVVPSFFKAAINNTPLLVHGNGEQTRSFCAVEDLVAGLIAVQTHGKSGTIYNVGNPHNKTTILQLAENIKRICKSTSAISLVDPAMRYGPHYLEAYNKMPAIERVIDHTGWTPKHPLYSILSSLHDHFKHAVKDSNNNSTQKNKTNSPTVADSVA